jgi:hypothetical protein
MKPLDALSEEFSQLHNAVWSVLEECWNHDPKSRPKVGTMAESLREGEK